MSHFRSGLNLPFDKESAEYTLRLFNDNALNWSYIEAFSHSIEILFGQNFIIRKDISGRMYFRCTVCCKDMNCSRSLQDHAFSGAHLKSVEFKSHESTSNVNHSIYSRDSLEYKLDSSNAITIGLERVEGFVGQKGRRYYKCTLCSAHGNVEAMFRHLVGDKHTDKLIKSRLVLKNSTITADERNILRKMLMDKEDYGVHNIKTIYGTEFYPSIWEAEGKYSRNKKSKTENCPMFEEKNSLKTEKTGKKEIISGDLAVIKQTFAIEDFKYLIDRFKFIVATHCYEETRFEQPEDLRSALIIMTFSLFWLHFSNRSFLQYDQTHHDHYLHQKEILTRCMGHVIDNLGATFNSKYPELAVVLKKEDETSTKAVHRTKPTGTKSQKINFVDLE